MALTVSQQPQELTPGYNDQFFTAISDQEGLHLDFIYVVTCIVNGDVANTYTENIEQNPTGYMVFNAVEKVKNYIKHYFKPGPITGLIEIATDKAVPVEVNISEYYMGTIQSTTTINYTAFDACLTDYNFRRYDFNDYLFGQNPNKFFLSKSETSITPDPKITIGSDLWLHFFNQASTPVDSIEILLRSSGGTVLQTLTPTLPTPLNAHDMLVMNLGPNIFTSPVASNKVDVRFKDSLGNTILRYQYDIVEICTIYKPYKMYYLDRDGNILFFNFERKSQINRSRTTNTVRLNKNKIVSGVYGSNEYDPELISVSTETEGRLTLSTNWISESQSARLTDLWDSPQRFFYVDSLYNPAIITETSYEEKIAVNDVLFDYTCTLDSGIKEHRQRGI